MPLTGEQVALVQRRANHYADLLALLSPEEKPEALLSFLTVIAIMCIVNTHPTQSLQSFLRNAVSDLDPELVDEIVDQSIIDANILIGLSPEAVTKKDK